MTATAEKVFDEIDTPIGGVPPDMIMSVWSKVEPILQRVVKPQTGYSLDHVLFALQANRQQLWVLGDFQAVAVTEIQLRPLHKILWCQFIAGDNVDDWLGDWEKVLVEYGRAHDCAAIEFSGRRGWNKFKSHYRDFKPVLTTYRKEL